MRDVIWPEPWIAVGQEEHTLVGELAKEVSTTHILYGKTATAIARRVDNDDVLFKIEGKDYQYAVVHLTWSGKLETGEKFPWTVLYPNFENWFENCQNESLES